jgi:hypothetical protein
LTRFYAGLGDIKKVTDVPETLMPFDVYNDRFDAIIAATALVNGLTLIHDNAGDFEAIRSAIERAPERFPGLGPLELIRCRSLAAT